MIVRRCHNGDYWDPLPMRVVFIYDYSIAYLKVNKDADGPVIIAKIVDEETRKRFQDLRDGKHCKKNFRVL